MLTKSLLAGCVGMVAFVVLLSVVLRAEEPDQPARQRPQELAAAHVAIANVALPTPAPYRAEPCDSFLAAVRVPPEVDLRGEGLLHAILFAWQDVASIWQVPPEESARLNVLLEACLRSDPDRPMLFPRDDLR